MVFRVKSKRKRVGLGQKYVCGDAAQVGIDFGSLLLLLHPFCYVSSSFPVRTCFQCHSLHSRARGFPSSLFAHHSGNFSGVSLGIGFGFGGLFFLDFFNLVSSVLFVAFNSFPNCLFTFWLQKWVSSIQKQCRTLFRLLK